MKFNKQPRGVMARIAALATAAALLAADQISKHFVILRLKFHGDFTVIPGLLEFSYVENTGAAFGMFQNRMWVVSLLAAIASAVILVLFFRYRMHSFFSYAASALLLAGGVGNMIDRMRFGFVVDYIHVLFFPYIFNFADCCITVGVVLFAIHMLMPSKEEKPADSEDTPQ